MSASRRQKAVNRKHQLINRKRRIQYRPREQAWAPPDRPMFTASNIHYELADRVRGLGRVGHCSVSSAFRIAPCRSTLPGRQGHTKVMDSRPED